MVAIQFVGALLLAAAQTASAIHKDQVGQLEWLKSLVGQSSHVSFARSQAGASLAVGSVLADTVAVLSPATGSIVWRHLLAANEALLHVSRVILAATSFDAATTTFHVRTFDVATGFALSSVVVKQKTPTFCDNSKLCEKQVSVKLVTSKTETRLVALLPGSTVVCIDLADSRIVWLQQLDASTSFSQLETSAGNLIVLGNANGVVDVELLSLADGSVKSSPDPSLKTFSCYSSASNAVICNALGRQSAIAAFVPGSQSIAWISPSDLNLGSINSQHLNVEPLSATEFIVSSNVPGAVSPASLVTVAADGNTPKVTVLHTFPEPKKGYKSVYSATAGDKRNPFVARLSFSTKKGKGVVDLFDIIENKSAGSFAVELDLQKTGSVTSIHLDTVVKDGAPTIRLLTYFQDGTMTLFQQGKTKTLAVKWERDESLAHITDSVFVDLPDKYSLDFDELGEPLKKSLELDPVTRYVKRLTGHVGQLQGFLKTLPTFLSSISLPQRNQETAASFNKTAPLVADRLGFRKLMILATSTGKLHALETKFGHSIWSRYFGDSTFSVKDLEVLRPTAVQNAAIIGLFGTLEDGKKSAVQRINAMTGDAIGGIEEIGGSDVLVLKVGQNGVNVYPIVDTDERVVLYPNSPEARDLFDLQLSTFYYYRIKKGDTAVRGFMVEKLPGGEYKGTQLWSVDLPAGEVVADYVQKDRTEPISSLGRVLGNRSVLYKYLNPNLLALATLRETKSTSNVYLYLIDTVTGSILHRASYLGAGHAAKGLDSIYLIQVDNSVILSYYNHGPEAAEVLVEPEVKGSVDRDELKETAGSNKRRKKNTLVSKEGNVVRNTSPNVKGYEITVLELYEMPKPDARIDSDTYTSFNTQKPSILQQTFVFPAQITAIGSTRTGAGITSREILFGLTSNQLYGVNLRILDPRRPTGPITSEDKEEMLFPYRATIDYNPKEFASHVLEVAGIKTIVSTPSSLESTSIVAAYGLDLFVVRRAPSKTFDLLSDDFGYVTLIVTLVSLVVGIQVAKHYAERKRVSDQWK
ncbi:hypothetical protein HDU79_001438 [Rhizoclosmatium sp. JEL0117]|nr:hypothetical protein HDU79_001438 [Rhizoclosmatium sp. JEL0117]